MKKKNTTLPIESDGGQSGWTGHCHLQEGDKKEGNDWEVSVPLTWNMIDTSMVKKALT